MKSKKGSLFFLSFLLFAALLSGCATFRIASEVQSGRKELMYGDPNTALVHFRRAAELNPNYIYNYSLLQQGVWTYVGRAAYNAGRLPEARQALERALSSNRDDHLAHLYFGLTLGRDGDRNRGVKEIETGLRGLHDWLDYLQYKTWHGQFWDPGENIRSEIRSALAMTSSKDVDWQRLIARGERVGAKMEEEIDLARRDEVKERTMEGEDNDGQP